MTPKKILNIKYTKENVERSVEKDELFVVVRLQNMFFKTLRKITVILFNI